MHFSIDYFAKLFSRVIDYVLRRRSIAGALIKGGIALAVPALASGWALGIFYHDSGRLVDLKLQTTDGIPAWAVLVALLVALGLVLIGGGIGVWDWWRAQSAENRRKSIIVELRGLHLSPDTPASTADLGLPTGQRDWQVVDFRPSREGALVDPNLVLEKLVPMKRAVESACGGRAKEDVTVALGGLAAVPALFLAGTLFDDESSVVIYDWDRNQKAWRLTDGFDDGKRMLPPSPEKLPSSAKQAVLAVSASYAVDEQGILKTFGADLPVVHLRAQETLADRLWSFEKQQAFVVAFRDAVQLLMAQGVEQIHLVLAAPSSLSIRMGMAYDRRLMPDLIVYQYERTEAIPYPWGLRMPTHGRVQPSVERSSAR